MALLPHVSALVLGVLAALGPRSARARFGDKVTDVVDDDRFEVMGQAYVETFTVTNDVVELEVVVEDTVDVYEFWLVDFQPYEFSPNGTLFSSATGEMQRQYTSPCASSFWRLDLFSPSYGYPFPFTDTGSFVPTNGSEEGGVPPKLLYNYYFKSDPYNITDNRGERVERTTNRILFQGSSYRLFNCTDTSGGTVWRYTNQTETVEFRSTVYFTNIRPIETSDLTKGHSYVQSHAELIYRISRIALVNVVVSSSALVKPLLNYVIISPGYEPDGTPATDLATVEIQFTTSTQSPSGERNHYIHSGTSLNYTADYGTLHDLDAVTSYPTTTPPCVITNGAINLCTQTWTFVVILKITPRNVDDGLPVDASGVFTFRFVTERCNDTTADESSANCTIVDNINPSVISMNITIQTVVDLSDEDKDNPWLVVTKLAGADNLDLRGGFAAGRRGVNHLEDIRMEVKFYPEFLWDYFDLDLKLFMVCIGDQTAQDTGCLAVTQDNRYVAHLEDDFAYQYVDGSGSTQSLSISDIHDAEWDPDNPEQSLNSHGYDSTNHLYHMDFTNTALSSERNSYTITTVYRLVEKTRRKKREAIGTSDVILNSHVVNNDVVNSHVVKRDIISSAELPQGNHIAFEFLGCPDGSEYDKDSRHCACASDNHLYSKVTFQCEPVAVKSDDRTPTKDSGAPRACAGLLPMSSLVLICMLCRYYE
ncbi:Hypp3931 [Branchiostoma lanceolatum]|uniref:Hypp3931 protein n=1 Tax=Branchiostoma lanceolatum TaxID=7740 RepID=A0A8K0A4C3_BRALA|nr:Hypp3931 [Branchiostoma lanceolatum]